MQSLLAAQKDNAVLWLPVLVGIGIAFYLGMHSEPPWWPAPLALFILAAATGVSKLILHRQITGWILSGLFLIALGFCAAQLRSTIVAAPLLEKPMKYANVEGTIETIDTLEGKKGVRVVLKNPVIEELEPEKTPKTIRLSIRKHEGLQSGQRIAVLASLTPPSAPVAPGSYDFQRHAYFQGIGAYGFAFKAPDILEQKTEGWLDRFRQNKAQHVGDVITENAESSIVSALLLGERAAIPEDAWEDIRAAGLAHVISISGLHISMIGLGVFFVMRLIMAAIPYLALHHPIKKYAALIGLISAIAYGIMVGLEIPTLRSIIMTGLILTAIMLDRDPFSLRLVALAAFLILLFQPEALLNPGFQMSFAAVAALIFFYDETRGFWSNLRKRSKSRLIKWSVIWLLGACITSVIATLATTPFTIFHFQQFPIYSVIGNILALPVISFVVMPAAIFAYILMPLGLDAPAIWVMGWGVHIMMVISREISSWAYSSFDLVTWPMSALLCIVIAGLWIMIFKGRLRYLSAPLLLAGCALIALYQPPDILVSSNTKLMMIRADHQTAWLSSKRREKFTAENWRKASGINAANVESWPKEGTLASPSNEADTLSCDMNGCHAHLKGARIAFSFSPATLAEDCALADLLISSKPVTDDMICINKQSGERVPVIDRWDLKDGGAHSIRIEKKTGNITVNNVALARGQRPWTASGSGR